MKRNFAQVVLAVVIALVLVNAVAAEGKKEAGASKIVIKLATVAAPIGVQNDGYLFFKGRLEQLTGNKVDFQIFPSGQLGEKTANMEALRAGTIEMTDVAATDMSVFKKRWQVFSLPYMFLSGDHLKRVVNDTTVRGILEKDLESSGFKLVALSYLGARSVVNAKKTVQAPADLNGLKIRVMQDKVLADSVKLMGANAVPFNWTEVYSGIQQKTLDGLEHSPFAILDGKFFEVAKFMSLTEHFMIPALYIVSLKVYNGLPGDVQKALLQAGQEYSEKLASIVDEANNKAVGTLKSNGMTVVSVEKKPFADAVTPIYEEFLGTAPPDTRELFDSIKKVK
jgi:tripartite ATP-independent transporter DctP family solute receptor